MINIYLALKKILTIKRISYRDSKFSDGWICFREEVLPVIFILLALPWFIFIFYYIIIYN